MNRKENDIDMEKSCREIVAGLKPVGKEWKPTYKEAFAGDVFHFSEEVEVGEPDNSDMWMNSFMGRIVSYRKFDSIGSPYYEVEDQEGDVFSVAEGKIQRLASVKTALAGGELFNYFNAVAPIVIYIHADLKYKKEALAGAKWLKRNIQKYKDSDIAEFMNGQSDGYLEDDYNDLFEQIVFSQRDWTPFVDQYGAKGFRDEDGNEVFSGDDSGYYPWYMTAESILGRLNTASVKTSGISYKGHEITIERNPKVGYALPWLWSVMLAGHLLHGAADTKEGALEGAKRAIDMETRFQGDARRASYKEIFGSVKTSDIDEEWTPGTIDPIDEGKYEVLLNGETPAIATFSSGNMGSGALDHLPHWDAYNVTHWRKISKTSSIKTALIPEDSPKGEGIPGAPGSSKSDNDKSMESDAPTEEEPGDKDLGGGWTDPTGGGMSGGMGGAGSPDAMSGEAQKRVSAPPEILRKFTPMDLQLFQSLEKQLLTALQTHNTTYMLQIENQMQDLVNKYVLGEPSEPLSGKGFIARMMKGHLALRRSMIPLLKKASTAIYAVMQNFPVIIKNVSLGSVHSGDYSATPDEGAVEWIVSLRRIGMPLYSKVGVLKVVVSGDNTYLKPTIWDISGNAFNLDSDGMDLFFGMRFQADIENIENAYMNDEKNARLKKHMPSTPLVMGRRPNTAPTSGFGGGDAGVY